MKRIAYYGGSFDPVHRGHLKIADDLTKLFGLDEFILVPAFHAPHKARLKPTSAYHRYAMLTLSTRNLPKARISSMELEVPDQPYTIDTLTKIVERTPEDQIFFVMGADSWQEITTWKEWEKVLSIVNIIVVTRPKYEIGFSHVTEEIRQRIIDLRKGSLNDGIQLEENHIFLTDAVKIDVSSTKIRKAIRDVSKNEWENEVSTEVSKYIKKYRLYIT